MFLKSKTENRHTGTCIWSGFAPSEWCLRRLRTPSEKLREFAEISFGNWLQSHPMSHTRVSWFEHPSYSSDLSLSPFCLIPKIKPSIKRWPSFPKPVSLDSSWASGACLSSWPLKLWPGPAQRLGQDFVLCCSLRSPGLFPSLLCHVHIADFKTLVFSSPEAFGIK